MKAYDVEVGDKVNRHILRLPWHVGRETGKIVSISSRRGDEMVIIEWDGDFSVSAENVNDLEVIPSLSGKNEY